MISEDYRQDDEEFDLGDDSKNDQLLFDEGPMDRSYLAETKH